MEFMRRMKMGAACLVGLTTAGCAGQQGGPAAQAMLQTAVNAMGANNAGLAGIPGTGAATGSSAAGGEKLAGGGKVVVINSILIAVEGGRPSDPRWAGKSIKDTPLHHFFEQHPISRPGEYFPRIGIRIDDFSPTLLSDIGITKHMRGIDGATARPPECLKFTAVVWASEKKSQRFDNMVLCNSDLGATEGYVSLGALKNYENNLYAPISISSMQVRTLGPRVPAKLLPDFTQADVALYSTGGYLFSALFSKLSYNGPVDGDQRLWFVNLAALTK